MVLNVYFAMGVLLQYGYLWKGYGPPVLGGLLALVVGGPGCRSASRTDAARSETTPGPW